MSRFIDFAELKYLKSEVAALHQHRKLSKSQREQFLDNIPSTLLLPNPNQDDLFYIGGHYVPVSEVEGSILTQGVSGGGKTLQLKPQIASAINAVRPGNDRRVIIADAKQDMLPFVAQLTKNRVPLLYFNVSDRRSIAYDIAKEIGGRSDKCGEAARQLIPTPKHGEPFWAQSAQALLQAGMLRLNQTQGVSWGLHDLYGMSLLALPELVEFLSVHPAGKQVAAKYLPDDRGGNTQFGFTSQLDVSLRQLEVAAAAQYYTPRSRWVTTSDFLDSESVLLIGTNTETRETTKPIVRLLFQNLVNRMNALPDSNTRKVFTFLDELPTWGFLPKIDELLAFSRSKGAVTSVVFQDIEQLNNLYGRSIAASLAGNCLAKLLFRPASFESAEWAIKTLGQHSFKRWEYSKQFTYEGITESQSLRVEKDFPLTTGELMDLGTANKRAGSKFVLMTDWSKPCIKHMTPTDIEQVQPNNASIPLLLERKPHQYNMPIDGNPRAFMDHVKRTFSNQDIREQMLSQYADNPIQQEIARQVVQMYQDIATNTVREFSQFYGNQQ